MVVGSFIIGLDVDKPGIGELIAETASEYGVDNLQVLFLTPLPGTRLMDQMISAGHIALDNFPEDWKYYTLTFPVIRHKHFSLDDIIVEMVSCDRNFYSLSRILHRVGDDLWQKRAPLFTLLGNLSFRRNLWLNGNEYDAFRNYYSNRTIV